MLTLKVKDRSLCLMYVYDLNAVSEYSAFVDYVDDALQRIGSEESTILLRDFNERNGTNKETWKGVIGRHEDRVFNENSRYLLHLCYSNELL